MKCMDNPLKGLTINFWYQLFAAIGAVGLLLSFFTPTYFITNKQGILISLGFLLIGSGTWRNANISSVYKEAEEYQSELIIGKVLIVLGILFFSLFILDYTKILSL